MHASPVRDVDSIHLRNVEVGGSSPLTSTPLPREREARRGKGSNDTRTGQEGGPGPEPATADGAPPRGDRQPDADRASASHFLHRGLGQRAARRANRPYAGPGHGRRALGYPQCAEPPAARARRRGAHERPRGAAKGRGGRSEARDCSTWPGLLVERYGVGTRAGLIDSYRQRGLLQLWLTRCQLNVQQTR